MVLKPAFGGSYRSIRMICAQPRLASRAATGHSALTVGANRRALPADRTVAIGHPGACVTCPCSRLASSGLTRLQRSYRMSWAVACADRYRRRSCRRVRCGCSTPSRARCRPSSRETRPKSACTRADRLSTPSAHRQHAGLRVRRHAEADAAVEGLRVRHVINITDVGHLTSDADVGDDKLELAARRERRTIWEIAEHYTEAFKADLARLRVGRAGAVVEGDRPHPADDRVRRGARPRGLVLRAAERPLLRHVPRRRLRQARPSRRRGPARGRPGRGRRGQAQPDRLRRVAHRRSGRAAADGVGLAVGPGRAGLAPRVLGDVDRAPRPPLRHPHRRRRPHPDPPHQRDRPERGVPRRRRGVGPMVAARRVHQPQGRQDLEVDRGRCSRRRPGRPRLPPARLPVPPAAGALPQPDRVQLGCDGQRPHRAASAARAIRRRPTSPQGPCRAAPPTPTSRRSMPP